MIQVCLFVDQIQFYVKLFLGASFHHKILKSGYFCPIKIYEDLRLYGVSAIYRLNRKIHRHIFAQIDRQIDGRISLNQFINDSKSISIVSIMYIWTNLIFLCSTNVAQRMGLHPFVKLFATPRDKHQKNNNIYMYIYS